MVVWPFLLKLLKLSPSQLWHWLFQLEPPPPPTQVLFRSKMVDDFNFCVSFFKSWIRKLTPHLWCSVRCSDRSRVVFWRTCFQRPGRAQVHHPANSTMGWSWNNGGTFCQCKSSKCQQMCPGPFLTLRPQLRPQLPLYPGSSSQD